MTLLHRFLSFVTTVVWIAFVCACNPDVSNDVEKRALLSRSTPVVRTDLTAKGKSDKEFSVHQRLQMYFGGKEIQPTGILNNVDPNKKSLELEGLTLTWLYEIDGPLVEFELNGKPITFKGKRSLNESTEGSEFDDMGFIGSWDRVALFETEKGSLALIEFSPHMCSGLMCGLSGYLLYDLKTGAENWFTAYFDEAFHLYDFKGDGTPDYLAISYFGNHRAGNYGHRYEFFSRQDSGAFEVAKDDKGLAYYFKREYQGPWDPYDVKELDSRFEQHWFEKIP